MVHCVLCEMVHCVLRCCTECLVVFVQPMGCPLWDGTLCLVMWDATLCVKITDGILCLVWDSTLCWDGTLCVEMVHFVLLCEVILIHCVEMVHCVFRYLVQALWCPLWDGTLCLVMWGDTLCWDGTSCVSLSCPGFVMPFVRWYTVSCYVRWYTVLRWYTVCFVILSRLCDALCEMVHCVLLCEVIHCVEMVHCVLLYPFSRGPTVRLGQVSMKLKSCCPVPIKLFHCDYCFILCISLFERLFCMVNHCGCMHVWCL